MLAPKRVKWRKVSTGRMRGKALKGNTLHFGAYGLQTTECGYVTARQIEAARVAMTRYIKRGGDIWVRIFPDKPRTKKPAETRMGKGKGGVEEWVAVVRPGRILYEMDGVPKEAAYEALRLAGHKLPVVCKVISKETEALAQAAAAKKAAEKLAKKKAKKSAEAAK